MSSSPDSITDDEDTKRVISRWPERQLDVTISRKITTPNEEDTLLRWPWIPHILENGNLFYIEPHIKPVNETEAKDLNGFQHGNSLSEKDENKKVLKGLGRIKDALLKKKALSKEDKDKGIDPARDQIIEENKINKSNSWPRKLSFQENNNILSKGVHFENDTANKNGDTGFHFVRKTVVAKLNHLPNKKNKSLLEERLGIVAFSSTNGKNGNDVTNDNGDCDIVIQEVLSNGPCANLEEVKIGCKLVAVNGCEVSTKSIEKILARLYEPCEVVLVIEESVSMPNKPRVKSRLLDLVSGVPEARDNAVVKNELACVAYLTLDCNENDKEGDILFWYPNCESAAKLRAIRGMFLTLGDLMDTVTGTSAKGSTLIMDGKVVNVCFAKENGNLLLVAAPAESCSFPLLEQSVQELQKLLCLLHGSLESTFKEADSDDVEHIIMLFMERLLGGLPGNSKDISAITAASFCGVRQLCLTSQHKVWISNTLSDAEAADYGECADDFFPHRRLYSTLGTCLFYKGHLVCNHLGEEETVDFLLYCKYYCLLLLNEIQKVNQMVIWREIFPSRKRRRPTHAKGSFEEPFGRWYFLAVSQKQSLLCMLLEAGGVASTPQGNPGPHPYYVDTAASILAYMQEHFDFETICEARLRTPPIPALASIEDLLINKSGRHSPAASPVDVAPRKLPAHLQHMATRAPMSPFEQVKVSGNLPFEDSPLSSQLTSPTTSRRHSWQHSEDSSSGNGSYNRTTMSGSAASVRKSMAGGMSGEFSALVTTKLTSGNQNVLFYYTSLDTSKGVLIAPNLGVTTDGIEKEILQNFRKASEKIRQVFKRNQRSIQIFTQKNGIGGTYQAQKENEQILEQGVLFRHRIQKNTESKKQGNFIKYWVVGRCLPQKSRQLFVCYRDGIPQNVVELGFKLGFGSM